MQSTARNGTRPEESERRTTVDRLTGAWNRRYLDQRVEEETRRCLRDRQPLAAMIFDIDRFRIINDQFGHAAGDQVLKELAQLARGMLQESDSLVRWGGEEFMVLMPRTDHRTAASAAEKLRVAIEGHGFATAGRVTVSVGVVELAQGETALSLFHRAEAALHRAKQAGRNRVETDAAGASDQW